MKEHPNIELFSPPMLLRLLNRIERYRVSRGKSFIDLNALSMMDSAMESTGLSDWGDENFYPALESLLNSCREEADLTLLGKYLCRMKIVELLKNRLCIQEEFKQHPEIAEEKILRPLFIASFPRSGTTLLHNLMSLDRSWRYLKGWESIYPSLHPKYAKTGKDPRIRLHENEIRVIRMFVPGAFRVHPMSVEGPQECHFLLAHTFVSLLSFEVLFDIPSHVRWAGCRSKVSVYRYYKKILQLLQWHGPSGPWVLKSPDHLGNLDMLFRVFPDARVVFIHRNPAEVVPSFCNLIAIGRSVHSNNVDLQAIGREYAARLQVWNENALQVRSLRAPGRFYDLDYGVFIRNPIGAVRGIYEYFNYDYDPDMDARMRQWLTGTGLTSGKSHRSTLEDFGLHKKMIQEKFDVFN